MQSLDSVSIVNLDAGERVTTAQGILLRRVPDAQPTEDYPPPHECWEYWIPETKQILQGWFQPDDLLPVQMLRKSHMRDLLLTLGADVSPKQ